MHTPRTESPLILVAALMLAGAAAGRAPAADAPAEAPAEAAASAGTEAASDGPADNAPADRGLLAQRRLEAQNRFLELYDAERFAEAAAAATEVIEITRQIYGDDSERLMEPLVNLADAQMRLGDLLGAEANFQLAIELIERAEGILAPELINPLLGLGATYARANLYPQAEQALQRALRINHVNEGFYNADQFRIRDDLSQTYLGLGDLEQANFHQEAQVQIQERRLGEDDPEVLDTLYKLATWYQRSGQPAAARLTYGSALRRLRTTADVNPAAAVRPLKGIAASYRAEGALAESVQVLKRALSVLDEEAEPDRLERAAVLVELGDIYQAFGKQNSSIGSYERAWNDLSTDRAYQDERDRYFADPTRVAGPYLPRRYPEREALGLEADSLGNGHVLVGFSVSASGRAEDVTVLESNPAGLMDKLVLDAVRKSAFRPRFAEGVPVAAADRTLRHDYQYPLRLAEAAPDPEDPPLPPPGGAGDPLPYPERTSP